MIPLVDDFIQRYGIKDFVLVADSGLMSRKNIELLGKAGYKYIIGARIKDLQIPIKTLDAFAFSLSDLYLNE